MPTNENMSMATIPLGVVLPGFVGGYDPEASYGYYDIVLYERDSYVAKQPTRGNPPTDEACWMRLTKVQRGPGMYMWIRYADAEPTSNGDMKTAPGTWWGFYCGASETAPENYADYTWHNLVIGEGLAAERAVVLRATLPQAEWTQQEDSEWRQTVALEGIELDGHAYTVSALPGDVRAYGEAGVICLGCEAKDTLLFSAAEAPDNDLTIQILKQKVVDLDG